MIGIERSGICSIMQTFSMPQLATTVDVKVQLLMTHRCATQCQWSVSVPILMVFNGVTAKQLQTRCITIHWCPGQRWYVQYGWGFDDKYKSIQIHVNKLPMPTTSISLSVYVGATNIEFFLATSAPHVQQWPAYSFTVLGEGKPTNTPTLIEPYVCHACSYFYVSMLMDRRQMTASVIHFAIRMSHTRLCFSIKMRRGYYTYCLSNSCGMNFC